MIIGVPKEIMHGEKRVAVIPETAAKLRAADVEAVVKAHTDEHMVKPKLVYISNSTESGAVYKKSELNELRDCCLKLGLYFYMDGARLGSALSSQFNDVPPEELSGYFDAFYVGGTKNGFLCGEALVISNDKLKEDFRFILKQRGAMSAKGFVVGVQFDRSFEGGLYFETAKYANKQSARIAAALTKAGGAMLLPAESNQIFPIFTNEAIAELHKDFGFYDWKSVSETESAIRIVCSWATTDCDADAFIEKAVSLLKKA